MKPRVTIYAVAILGMIIGWGMLAGIPNHRKAMAERLAALAATQRLIEIRQLVETVPSILETEKRMSKEQSDLNSRLYAREDVLHLFEELKAAAKHYRLQVDEITPPVEELLALNQNGADSNQPQFINMTVRLNGGYIDFGRYVEALEGADFFRGVNRCLVTGAPDGKEPLQLTVAFKALLGIPGVTS